MNLSVKQVEEALASNHFLNSEIKSAEFEGMSSDGIFVYKCIFADGMYGKRECKGIIKIRFRMRVNEDEYTITGEY